MRTLHNWPETVGRCLFIGAVVGACGTIGILMAGSFFQAQGATTNVSGLLVILALSYFFVLASLIWFLGLALFGLWPWCLLHVLGFRGKLAAAALGFTLPVLVWSFLSGGQARAFSLGMGAVGILVAEAIWYSAYKRGAGADESRSA